ncbi:protein FAM186A [Rhynchocyon petersi]
MESEPTSESHLEKEIHDSTIRSTVAKHGFHVPAVSDLEVPFAAQEVISKINQAQLCRAKKDIDMQLNDILCNVQRIINRYSFDQSLISGRRVSIIDTNRKRRPNIMEKITTFSHSLDVREKILAQILAWLEEWNVVLSEITATDTEEHSLWLPQMELLPETLKAVESSVKMLHKICIYLFEDKKKHMYKRTSRRALWKPWKDRVKKRPATAYALRPDQMISDEFATNTKVSEIEDMLQELVGSSMFTKMENSAIKYISSTITNLSKALSIVNEELKLGFQNANMLMYERVETERDLSFKIIQDLSEKNEMLQQQLQNVEEKCEQLIRSKSLLEQQLQMFTGSALKPQTSLSIADGIEDGIDNILAKELENVDEVQRKGNKSPAIKSAILHPGQTEMNPAVTEQQHTLSDKMKKATPEDKADIHKKNKTDRYPRTKKRQIENTTVGDASILKVSNEKGERKVSRAKSTQYIALPALVKKGKERKSLFQDQSKSPTEAESPHTLDESPSTEIWRPSDKNIGSVLWEGLGALSEYHSDERQVSSEVKEGPTRESKYKESRSEMPLPPSSSHIQSEKMKEKKQHISIEITRSKEEKMDEKGTLATTKDIKPPELVKSHLGGARETLEPPELVKLHLGGARETSEPPALVKLHLRARETSEPPALAKLHLEGARETSEPPELVKSHLGAARETSEPPELVKSHLGAVRETSEPPELVKSHLGAARETSEPPELVKSHLGAARETSEPPELVKSHLRARETSEPPELVKLHLGGARETSEPPELVKSHLRARETSEPPELVKLHLGGARETSEPPELVKSHLGVVKETSAYTSASTIDNHEQKTGEKRPLALTKHTKLSELVKLHAGGARETSKPISMDDTHEQSNVDEFQKVIMAFLKEKIDNMGKPADEKTTVMEELLLKKVETKKTGIVKAKLEDYFQKVGEIIAKTLKKYKDVKKIGQFGETPEKPKTIVPLMAGLQTQKSSTSGAYEEISTFLSHESTDPAVSNVLQMILTEVESSRDVSAASAVERDPKKEGQKQGIYLQVSKKAATPGLKYKFLREKEKSHKMVKKALESEKIKLRKEEGKQSQQKQKPLREKEEWPEGQKQGAEEEEKQEQKEREGEQEAKRYTLKENVMLLKEDQMRPAQEEKRHQELVRRWDKEEQKSRTKTDDYESQRPQKATDQLVITVKKPEDSEKTESQTSVLFSDSMQFLRQKGTMRGAFQLHPRKEMDRSLKSFKGLLDGKHPVSITPPASMQSSSAGILPGFEDSSTTWISEQAQALGMTLTFEQAESEGITLTPEKAQALGFTLTPQHTQLEGITPTPGQAHAGGISRTTRQDQELATTVTSEQDQAQEITLTSQLSQEQGFIHTPMQAHAQEITLTPEEAKMLGIILTPEQANAQRITLICEQEHVTPKQVETQEIIFAPEEAHTQEITFTPQQARTLGMTFTSEQAQALGIIVTPEEAQKQGITLTLQQVQALGITLTPQKVKAPGITLTPEQAQAKGVTLTPQQAQVLGITLTPEQTRARESHFIPQISQEPGMTLSPVHPQTQGISLTHQQAQALGFTRTPQQVKTPNVAVTPKEAQAQAVTITPHQDQPQEITLIPQHVQAMGVSPTSEQYQSLGVTLASEQAQELRAPLTLEQAPKVHIPFTSKQAQKIGPPLQLDKAQTLVVPLTPKQTQALKPFVTLPNSAQAHVLQTPLTKKPIQKFGAPLTQGQDLHLKTIPEHMQAPEAALMPEVSLVSRLSLTHEQAQSSGVPDTLENPLLKQTHTLGVISSSKQAQIRRVSLIPGSVGQSQEVGVTTTQENAWVSAPTLKQVKTLGPSFTLEQAQALKVPLTPGQFKRLREPFITSTQVHPSEVPITGEEAQLEVVTLMPEQAPRARDPFTGEQPSQRWTGPPSGHTPAIGIVSVDQAYRPTAKQPPTLTPSTLKTSQESKTSLSPGRTFLSRFSPSPHQFVATSAFSEMSSIFKDSSLQISGSPLTQSYTFETSPVVEIASDSDKLLVPETQASFSGKLSHRRFRASRFPSTLEQLYIAKGSFIPQPPLVVKASLTPRQPLKPRVPPTSVQIPSGSPGESEAFSVSGVTLESRPFTLPEHHQVFHPTLLDGPILGKHMAPWMLPIPEQPSSQLVPPNPRQSPTLWVPQTPGKSQKDLPSSDSVKRKEGLKFKSALVLPSTPEFKVQQAPFTMEKFQMPEASETSEETHILQDHFATEKFRSVQPSVRDDARTPVSPASSSDMGALMKPIVSFPSLTPQQSKISHVSFLEREQKSRFPPIDKSFTLTSVSAAKKLKTIVPEGLTEKYFVDVVAQRRNLVLLNQAMETSRFPLQLYTVARKLITETLYMDSVRLGYIFHKYIAYWLIQHARNNIIKRLKTIQNTGKGYEARDLYMMLNRIDDYQKKMMQIWMKKQKSVEEKRNQCLRNMIYLFSQIQKMYNLKLSQPIPLMIDEKQVPDSTGFIHLPESLLEETRKMNTPQKYSRQTDHMEPIWNSDIATSSYPITEKKSIHSLWVQLGGYPDVPRLLQLDIHSTFRKSLASIQSR